MAYDRSVYSFPTRVLGRARRRDRLHECLDAYSGTSYVGAALDYTVLATNGLYWFGRDGRWRLPACKKCELVSLGVANEPGSNHQTDMATLNHRMSYDCSGDWLDRLLAEGNPPASVVF